MHLKTDDLEVSDARACQLITLNGWDGRPQHFYWRNMMETMVYGSVSVVVCAWNTPQRLRLIHNCGSTVINILREIHDLQQDLPLLAVSHQGLCFI